MASGSFTGTNNGQVQCKINWSSSAGTGGSSVSASLIAQNINGYYFNAIVYYGYSLNINGSSNSGSGGRLSGSSNGAVTLLSHSAWVGYTGNKSITISGSINLTGILNGGTVTCSGTASLDKVGTAPTTPTVTAPKAATISETTQTITISWTASTSYSGTGNYILQVSINNGAWTDVSTGMGWDRRSVEYTIPDHSLGTTYKFRVAARNDVGVSGYSESGVVAINSMSPPTIGTLGTFNPYVSSYLTVPLSGGAQNDGSAFKRCANVYVDGALRYTGTIPSSYNNSSVSIYMSSSNILADLGTTSYSSSTRFSVVAWIQNANGTKSSTVSKTFTVNINSDGGATPSLGAPTLSGGALGYPSTCFVSGISSLNVTSPSATIRRAPSGTTVSYAISCTGASTKSGTSANFGSLSAGTKTITVTATDSRGLSTSVTKQCVFQSYAAPTISNVKFNRLQNPNTSATLTYTAMYTPVYQYPSPTTRGSQLNNINKQQYTLNSVNWYDCESGDTITGLSTEQTYNVVVRVSDNVRPTNYVDSSGSVSTIQTLFSMRQWGVGVNRVPSNGISVDVDGTTRTSNAFIATTANKSSSNDGKTGVIVSGYGLMGLVATTPYINFHQGNATDYTHRIVADSSGFNFYSKTGIHWYTGNGSTNKHAWIDSNGHMSIQGNITATGTITGAQKVDVQTVEAELVNAPQIQSTQITAGAVAAKVLVGNLDWSYLTNKPAKVGEIIAVTGTVVFVSSGNSRGLHSFDDVKEFFRSECGIVPTDMYHVIAVYNNGDGNAVSAHVEGCTIQNSVYWAVYDRSVSGSFRINYAYIYDTRWGVE